jgi:hypothetical protein
MQFKVVAVVVVGLAAAPVHIEVDLVVADLVMLLVCLQLQIHQEM